MEREEGGGGGGRRVSKHLSHSHACLDGSSRGEETQEGLWGTPSYVPGLEAVAV